VLDSDFDSLPGPPAAPLHPELVRVFLSSRCLLRASGLVWADCLGPVWAVGAPPWGSLGTAVLLVFLGVILACPLFSSVCLLLLLLFVRIVICYWVSGLVSRSTSWGPGASATTAALARHYQLELEYRQHYRNCTYVRAT
jgi:hypothetical protein